MKHLIVSVLLAASAATLNAQSVRYLEKKGFEEGSVEKGNGQFMVSINKENTTLAVCDIQMEMERVKMRMKASYYAKLLNLTTGKLERSYEAASLYYFDNSLVLADATASHGKWEEFTKVSMPLSYEFDPVTGERKIIPLPEGFGVIGTQGKYVLATKFSAGKSIVLEKEGDSFKTVHELDLTFIKVTEDGKYAYGVKGFTDQNILVYDMRSGRLVSTIRNSTAIQFQYLKKGHLITSSMNKIFIMDGEGNPVREFNTGPYFSVNDDETEIITTSLDGTISLFDLNSGALLTQLKDTQVTKAENSSKRVGLPYKIGGGEFYLIPYSTGIVSLFSSNTRSIVANLFFDQEDWAVIAKDGRIDGTLGALDKLEWVEYNANGKVKSRSTVEASFEKFFTPRLLKLILSGDAGTASVEQTIPAGNEMMTPVIQIVKVNGGKVSAGKEPIPVVNTSQKTTIIEVTAGEHADKIREVRLYHNGKLVGAQPVSASNQYQFTISLNSIFGDNNSVYAVATTNDGVDSEKSRVLIVYKKKENVRPKLYALVVGVNKYMNPKYELNYAIPDATAFRDQLQKNNSTILESVEVLTLFDKEVTRESVRQKFDELSKKIGEQDIFIFYYAGHGTMHEVGTSKEFFIVPHDVSQLYGNEAVLKEKAISAAELKSLSMNLNAQKQVYIIDACHSASALSSVATRGAAEEIAIAQLARSTGTFWLTAAGSDQFATELQQLGHGVFTYSLLEALQGKDSASASDGSITIREISSYVERRVPELSTQYKGQPQYPSSFSFGNDFPLVVN